MNLSSALSRFWRNELGYKAKDFLRPVKHSLFGKTGIYRALDELHDPKVLLDVGAAIGETAVPMRKRFPNAKVYAIEPNPVQFKKLAKKGFKHNVWCYNLGISDAQGVKMMTFNPSHPDAGSLYGGVGVEVPVRVDTLDAFCEFHGIKGVDFLKIDTEGWELNVLKGAAETLKNTKAIYVEISKNWYEVMTLLHDAGFRLADNYGDYFFIKQ
jgi:FkbM family methyltransferase